MISFAIEQDIFDEKFEPAYNAIKENHCDYKNVVYRPFYGIHESPIDSNDPNVIFLGSLNLATHVIKSTKWKIWCDVDKFNCSYYYNYLGEYLLNSNYIFLSLKEAIRQKEMIFDLFGDDCFFIRPDNGYKSFKGNVINCNNFEKEMNQLTNEDSSLNQLCVITSPKNIDAEYRFFIIDGKPVTASQYHLNNRLNIAPDAPKEIWDYATKIAKIWQPESAYVLDIGKIKDKIGVVEINSFSCSGFYACDQKLIVENIIQLFNKENT